MKVASGDWDYITSYTDRAQLTVIVANPGVNEAEINDCYVVGFSFSSKSGKYKDDFTIELANGIKLFESTESDIKTAYGAPEYRSENEYSDGSGTYVSIDYAGDDEKDGMDFDVTPEKNLISIRLINSKMPEGATSVADLSMDAPAINDQYVAPGGQVLTDLMVLLQLETKIMYFRFHLRNWRKTDGHWILPFPTISVVRTTRALTWRKRREAQHQAGELHRQCHSAKVWIYL